MTTLRLNSFSRARCPLLGDSLFVWVQGCPRRCKGCFNVDTLDVSGPSIHRSSVAMVRHWSRKRGGLVLSGGEPFLQAEGLAELCQGVRALAPATPILVYTGYLLEELLGGNRPGWRSLLQSADVLIDGPYVADNPSGCALAGSGNQRVFVFGDRIDSSKLASLPSFLVQARIERRGMVRLVGTGAINMHGLVRRIESTGFRLEE